MIDHYAIPLYPAAETDLEPLRGLLDDVRARAGADIVAIYAPQLEADPRDAVILSTADGIAAHPDLLTRLYRLLRDHLELAHDAEPKVKPIPAKALAKLPLRVAYGINLNKGELKLGALFIGWNDEGPADIKALCEALAPTLFSLRLLLENDYLNTLLAENLATARSILAAAQAISDNSSPQAVVNILKDTLFGPHISSCAMLLYGPVTDENPHGPFEYLEFAGTWSKRLGSGIGMGVRLYLRDYPDVLAKLEQDKIVSFPNIEPLRAQFDPLIRGFLRAERIRSLTLVALQSARRRLGVIVIGTDRPHHFSTRELHSYQTVAEFLTINAMAQIFRQQHDRVQQGRAALLDAVTDGVIMVLPRGSGGHVLTVNQRFTRQFEVSADQVQGHSLATLLGYMQIPEDTRQELRQQWLQTPVNAPDIRRGEFRMVTSEGQPVDIEWYSAPVYLDKRVLGRIYLFHDCTAERTAARLRAEFLSRVSHELRTPLTSIQGFAEFILEATGDQLPDLAREYTEIILNSAKHLNQIFNEMIEITRADAGKMQLDKTTAHLPDLIIEIGARMELQYKERGQRLVLELDDDLPPVSVDKTKIAQVLINLFANAIKYSPPGGTIRISTQHVTDLAQLPEEAPRDVVLPAALVTIVDEGAGLTREEAQKVFLPFFRTAEAKQNKIEGVGLGLAVTRSIIEVHRGRIWALPRPLAQGGCFMFTLPTLRE